MKITLTIDEIREIIRARYGMGDIELSISYPSRRKGSVPTSKNLLGKLVEYLIPAGLTPFNTVPAEKKISLIKAFRDFYSNNGNGCGVAEAKAAIEDWHNFWTFSKVNGLPLDLNGCPWI